MNKLYGTNGSEWKQVGHIPRVGEERGIQRFELNGNWYRNEYGKTFKMVKLGRDTWASKKNWSR